MYEFLYESLPFLIFLGIITSYEDFKHGLIRNKWIVISLIFAFLIAIIKTIQDSSYLLKFLLQFLLASFYGIVIWLAGLWSAGDSKLFIAFSALIPFQSFNLLVNTFVPIFSYFFIISIFRTKTQQKIKVAKQMFKPKLVVSILLFLFSFGWLIRISFEFFGIAHDFFLMVFMLFILMFIVEKLFPKRMLLIVSILAIVALIFDYRSFNQTFIFTLAIMLLLFLFLRFFVLNLTYSFLSYPIYIEKLRPGMFLAENISRKDFSKKRSVSISFIQNLLESNSKTVFGASAEGVTEEEVKEIQHMHNQGKIKDHTIRIYHTTAFAPLMLLGVVITLLIKTNIIAYLMSYF